MALACESRFTGIYSASNALGTRAADPAIALWGAQLAASPGVTSTVSIGGAAPTEELARWASIGEGIERHRAHPLPTDERMSARFDHWTLNECVIGPGPWALFHADQLRSPEFPFVEFCANTECLWTRFRAAGSGEPVWIPEDLAYLFPAPGETHKLAPGSSTGLVAGKVDHPLLLRGTQECIERDAIVGAWWGNYGVREHDAERVFAALGTDLPFRLRRPNLRYRFFELRSPFSAGVALVTLTGQDVDRELFSAGAACRETLTDAFAKGAIEAVQGRHFVRYLLTQPCSPSGRVPTSFAEHASYYTLNPERLKDTVLHHAEAAATLPDAKCEGLTELRHKLGEQRPALFRLMTPPNIAQTMPDWAVLRVIIPGLQPIHGHHHLPHLGGTLWGKRPAADYDSIAPHPMP